MTRRQDIVATLQQDAPLSVRTLAARFDVSPMTIYRDLQQLAQQGHVIRTVGGAMLRPVAYGRPWGARAVEQAAIKWRLGVAAAALLHVGETVFLDTGTTSLAVAQHLPATHTGIVVTPSLPAAVVLGARTDVTVLMPSGQVSGDIASVQGSATLPFLNAFHVDTYVCTVAAVSLEAGLLHGGLDAVAMKRMMIAQADRVLVVVDATKFRQTAPLIVAPLTAAHVLITDTRVPESLCQRVTQQGVDLVLVPYEADLEERSRESCPPLSQQKTARSGAHRKHFTEDAISPSGSRVRSEPKLPPSHPRVRIEKMPPR